MKQTIAHKIIATEEKNISKFFFEKGKIYTFLNPVSYLTAVKEKKLFEKFDGIFADGSRLVFAILCLYGRKVTRRSFDMVGIAPALFSFANDMGKSVYFIGAEQNEIEKAVDIFKAHYPKMIVAGFRNGFFKDDYEIGEEVKRVVQMQPDYLIVGMGACKQEQMLLRIHDAGYEGLGFTCGGFLRQTSLNKINFYPAWADRWNLRFAYRMIKEKHTRSRYILATFKFPLRFLKERITGR